MMALRERIDPRHHNGGVFLGLNGISVKSHGGMDDVGFATAIGLAVDMVADDLIGRITADMAQYTHHGVDHDDDITDDGVTDDDDDDDETRGRAVAR
jgi:glycerol-3-phosphate acyltransferase PlsX